MSSESSPEVQRVNVHQMVLFPDEFTGRQFYGQGNRPKGAVVSAVRVGRVVRVMFEAVSVHGDRDSVDYPLGATVGVAAAVTA